MSEPIGERFGEMEMQQALQGLAEALAVTLETVEKLGVKALDDLGQVAFDRALREARAALDAAKPFLPEAK